MNDFQETTNNTQGNEETIARKKDKLSLSLSVLSLLIALVAIVIAFVFGKPASEKTTTNNAGDNQISIAWVNVDTLLEKYAFVEELNNGMIDYEKKLQNQLIGSYSAFEKEYNDYIAKASNNRLTLAEQKATEEQLAKKQQALQELDGQLSQQLSAEKLARQLEVHDTIADFIARFNKNHRYTFILEKSIGGSLLWADSTYDLTPEILKGLNDEYQARQKIKEDNK